MSGIEEFDFGGSAGATVAEESMKSGSFEREVMFLSLDGSPGGKAQGKDKILLRFLTDSIRRDPSQPMTKFSLAWLTIEGHYAPTKARPPYAKEGATWPTKMGSGCRKDKVFAKKFNDSCYICGTGSKSSKRVWALAVEREEVRNEQGQILGYKDKTREVFDHDAEGNPIVLTDDGKKKTYQMKTVPAYIVMSMGWKNFFQPLSAQAQYFGSLLDGDWLITRTGTDNNDTAYSPIRVAEQFLPEGNPYGLPAGTKYDLGIPGLMEAIYPDMPDLRQILADRVSDEYFGRFFVPGWMPEGFDAGAVNQQAAQPATAGAGMMMSSAPAPQAPASPPQEEASSDALAALKNRVIQQQGGAPAADAAPAQ